MKNTFFDYSQLINSLLREVNQDNLKTFDFSKKDIFSKIDDELMYKLPFDLFETLKQYIDLVIEQVLEIRKEDCINVFTYGFKNGIEFERYLKDKHEKSEP